MAAFMPGAVQGPCILPVSVHSLPAVGRRLPLDPPVTRLCFKNPPGAGSPWASPASLAGSLHGYAHARRGHLALWRLPALSWPLNNNAHSACGLDGLPRAGVYWKKYQGLFEKSQTPSFCPIAGVSCVEDPRQAAACHGVFALELPTPGQKSGIFSIFKQALKLPGLLAPRQP